MPIWITGTERIPEPTLLPHLEVPDFYFLVLLTGLTILNVRLILFRIGRHWQKTNKQTIVIKENFISWEVASKDKNNYYPFFYYDYILILKGRWFDILFKWWNWYLNTCPEILWVFFFKKHLKVRPWVARCFGSSIIVL